MAIRSSTAILTRIREVLEDGAGALRTITASTYEPGAGPLRSDAAQATDALIKARVEVQIVDTEPHPARPPRLGTFTLDTVSIEVRIVRSVTAATALNATTRTALLAAADEDASRVSQVLTAPGNLTTTSAGAATGLVSGMLEHAGSQIEEPELAEGQSGRLVAVHTFTGIVRTVTPFTPLLLSAPVITGTVTVGSTLTCSTGAWDGRGETPTYSYEWLRSGNPISNASLTSGTYELVADDAGETISCVVTATNSGGAASAASNTVGPVP